MGRSSLNFRIPIPIFSEQTKGRQRKGIPKSLRDAVWNTYVGANKAYGKCYACEKHIHFQDFEVGHNKSVYSGGTNHIGNLRPICRSCNRSMKTMSIERYKKKYFGKPTKTKKVKKKRSRQKQINPYGFEFPKIKFRF